MLKKMTIHIMLVAVVILFLVALAVSGVANVRVERAAKGHCYDSTDDIPYRRVSLLLGTTPIGPKGGPNPYFRNRIAACARLYHAGKVSKVLVSGDNCRRGYNEPEDMRQALMEAGVPDSNIVLDYAGFRTYDSMVRAKKVFGQDSLTVISQQWHNERALYIAGSIGMDAVAYNAVDVRSRSVKLKLAVREWLSRTKMVFDLLLKHDPHFLGDPITI